MARTKSQRSKTGSGRARTPRRPPPATRTRPRAASGDTSTGMLAGAGSAMGKVLQKSSEVVKEAGTGLLNTARQAVVSTVTGEHDAVSVLKAQHREVEALFQRVLSSDDPRARKALLGEIAAALAMHTKIEEDIFYPAVRSLGTEALEKLIDEALEEHHVVDLVLAELPRVSPRDDRFVAKMTVLSEVVEHHVKEEESDMFKRAQALGVKRLTELGEQLAKAAARYQRGAGKSA